MLIGTRSAQKITITNTGHLEFNFNVMFKKTFDIMQAELLKQSAIDTDDKSLKKNKTPKGSISMTKSTRSSKQSNKKSKNNTNTSGRQRYFCVFINKSAVQYLLFFSIFI